MNNKYLQTTYASVQLYNPSLLDFVQLQWQKYNKISEYVLKWTNIVSAKPEDLTDQNWYAHIKNTSKKLKGMRKVKYCACEWTELQIGVISQSLTNWDFTWFCPRKLHKSACNVRGWFYSKLFFPLSKLTLVYCLTKNIGTLSLTTFKPLVYTGDEIMTLIYRQKDFLLNQR